MATFLVEQSFPSFILLSIESGGQRVSKEEKKKKRKKKLVTTTNFLNRIESIKTEQNKTKQNKPKQKHSETPQII